MLTCDKCTYEGYKTCKCTIETVDRKRDIISELVSKINALETELEELKLKNRVLQSTLDYFKNEENIAEIRKFYEES